MRRRQFIGLAGCVVAWPLGAHAQRAKDAQPARIATLHDLAPLARDWLIAAMRDQGWIEGRDFALVQSGVLFAGPGLDEAAAHVVASKPDLILVAGSASALAARRITSTIPIVMWLSGYPVEAGLAESLARPGKNVTGNAMYVDTQIWGKLLQLLHEAKPGIARVSVLWTYVPPVFPQEEIEPCYAELRAAGGALGLSVHIVEAATADDVPAALAEIDAQRADALLLTGGLPLSARAGLMRFAAMKSLCTITDFRWGGAMEIHPLLSYGPVFRELMQSAVGSIIKILQGARPGDIPIQRPARFQMTVNLKTARALGLTIPQSILVRADEVIE